jgi:hypothetical protein
MPTRPKNRQLDVTVRHWKGPPKNLRADRLLQAYDPPPREFRRVDVVDGAAIEQRVVFYVSFDPNRRDAIVQNPMEIHGDFEFQASSLRVPVQTYLRAVRHAIRLTDEGHLRYELRGGKLYELGQDAPIVLGELPRRRYHRERHDLEQVAAIYRDNPRAPVKAIRLAFNVSQRTAARRVDKAREAGLLPPAAQRRPQSV